MSRSQIDVRKTAKLARLALDDNEIDRYAEQLSAILGYVEEIAELPTDDVPATARVIDQHNVDRDDVVTLSLTREAVLAGAPQSQAGMIRVPRILAETE